MNENIDQDEIRLEDILRVLWKWKFFIIGITTIAVVISIFISFSKKPIFSISGKVRRTVWGNNYSNKNEIEAYIKRYTIFKEVLKNNENYLELLKSQSGKEDIEDIYQWFEENITLELKDISSIIELEVKSPYKEYLKEIASFYINTIYNYENSIYQEKKESLSKIYTIDAIGLSPAIIQNPVENVIIEDGGNKLKMVIIVFAISLFISIFLSFIIDYISRIEWKKIF